MKKEKVLQTRTAKVTDIACLGCSLALQQQIFHGTWKFFIHVVSAQWMGNMPPIDASIRMLVILCSPATISFTKRNLTCWVQVKSLSWWWSFLSAVDQRCQGEGINPGCDKENYSSPIAQQDQLMLHFTAKIREKRGRKDRKRKKKEESGRY